MNNEESVMSKKIIEVNGVKMELDARTATIQSIDTFKVGDACMVLVPDRYDSKKKMAVPAVITAFANFKANPTIVVSYLLEGYSDVEMKTAYLNKDSSDVELVRIENNSNAFEVNKIRTKFLKTIDEKKKALFAAEDALANFDKNFGMLMAEMEHEKSEGE